MTGGEQHGTGGPVRHGCLGTVRDGAYDEHGERCGGLWVVDRDAPACDAPPGVVSDGDGLGVLDGDERLAAEEPVAESRAPKRSTTVGK